MTTIDTEARLRGRARRAYACLSGFALRHRLRVAELRSDESGSQITDNLGLIVIGIVAIVAIGGLISGLDSTVFSWITGQLGLSS
jgi:hypothetical protein